MKTIGNVLLAVAAISVLLGVISRFTLAPIGPSKVEAQAFLQFANTCLLGAIALQLKAKA